MNSFGSVVKLSKWSSAVVPNDLEFGLHLEDQ